MKRYEETLHQVQKDLERTQENHRNSTVQVEFCWFVFLAFSHRFFFCFKPFKIYFSDLLASTITMITIITQVKSHCYLPKHKCSLKWIEVNRDQTKSENQTTNQRIAPRSEIRTNNNKHRFNPSHIGRMRVPVCHKVFSMHSLFFLQITNLEKNVQNLKVQLAGAHGNHKEAMDQVI